MSDNNWRKFNTPDGKISPPGVMLQSRIKNREWVYYADEEKLIEIINSLTNELERKNRYIAQITGSNQALAKENRELREKIEGEKVFVPTARNSERWV